MSPVVLGLTYWEEEATGDGWGVEVGSPVISGVKGLISVREVTVYEPYHLGAGRLEPTAERVSFFLQGKRMAQRYSLDFFSQQTKESNSVFLAV